MPAESGGVDKRSSSEYREYANILGRASNVSANDSVGVHDTWTKWGVSVLTVFTVTELAAHNLRQVHTGLDLFYYL